MRVKPHVNAINMKTMITFGQNPTRLILFEFRQTHGAIHDFRASLGRINKHGKRFQHRRVEAAGVGGIGRIRIRGVHVEHEMRTPVPVPAYMSATGLEEVPARIEVQTHHQNHDEEQYDNRAQHYFPAQSVALVGVEAGLTSRIHVVFHRPRIEREKGFRLAFRMGVKD